VTVHAKSGTVDRQQKQDKLESFRSEKQDKNYTHVTQHLTTTHSQHGSPNTGPAAGRVQLNSI
jgi:hypothetical protein